jgi:glycosyltransferase involved in cell wall biosynthesis
MNPITVSVVLPTYNRAQYLRAALDSVLAQTRPPDEIIVVDDGSTDETATILADYAGTIRLFRQANAGKPAALNYAIPRAKGSHIWLFDDDDIALPHALASHVDFLQKNSEVDFSFSENFTFDGDGDIWDRTRWRRGASPDLSEDTLLVALMKRCTLVFQGLLVPARCFQTVGLFDESLVRAQDYDMLLKLARRFVGRATGQTTFVWRNHTGERGGAGERHADSDRAAVFRKYERRIFTSVWQEFALTEYLPAKAQASAAALSEADHAAALLARSDIMFRHDLFHQGAQDLSEALARITMHGPELATAMAVTTRAADVADPVFIPGVRLRSRCLARAIRGPYRKRLMACARKGCYWSIRRALSKRRWHDTLALIVAGAVLELHVATPRRSGGYLGEVGE